MLSLRKDDNAIAFQLLISAGFAIILVFAVINVGTYINSNVAQETADNLNLDADGGDNTVKGTLANKAYNTTRNISIDYDNVLDSLTIATVIMAITLPLVAIVMVRKFF